MLLASAFVNAGYATNAACLTSSHFCTAERQYRFPLGYGGQRTPTSQWTVTGSGAALVSAADNLISLLGGDERLEGLTQIETLTPLGRGEVASRTGHKLTKQRQELLAEHHLAALFLLLIDWQDDMQVGMSQRGHLNTCGAHATRVAFLSVLAVDILGIRQS